MSLSAGARLGPYEIVAPLGAGGMGQVFKARDTRLDRSVAIKVLPPEFAENAQLKLRFEREAKTISQLNHPNICTLHDVGEGYLVMELLEGETLADKIAKGPLPIDQVLRYGIEIAEALEKAHKAGVVHRDLKPGNVMITKSGAKLLDFGLAKSSPTIDLNAQTQHKPLTSEGMLLGTFQYMAPEQLEGQAADARTDIFAFGVVLYEMATGKRAFEGKTKTSLIAAIVSGEPKSLRQLMPLAPSSLEHVVTKCLTKDPDERWQNAHDVAEELRWVRETAGAAQAVAAARRPYGAIAIAFLAGLIVSAAGFMTLRNRFVPKRPTTRLSIPIPGTLALGGYATSNVAISPNGRYVAFVGDRNGITQVFLRNLSSLETIAVPASERATSVFFSPDSRWVGFHTGRYLQKASVDGGNPQPICEAAEVRGASWVGNLIAFATGTAGISTVPATGGQPHLVAREDQLAGEDFLATPVLLPGDETVLVCAFHATRSEIIAVSVKTGKRTPLISEGASPQFVNGYLFFAKGTSVFAVRFDPKTLQMTGSPIGILDGVYTVGPYSVTAYAVGADGTLVYASGPMTEPKRTLVWVDLNGKVTPTAVPPEPFEEPRLSPDGTHVAVASRSTDNADVWNADLQRNTVTRVTFDPGEDETAAWSRDGQRIAFAASRTGHARSIYWRRADGVGGEEKLLADAAMGGHPHMSDFSPDSQWMAYTNFDPAFAGDIWVMSMLSGKSQPLVRSPFNERAPRFSMDGKFIAYTSNESGRDEIYVQSFPGSGGKWQVSNEGGIEAVWSKDGKELFYRNGDKMMVVDVVTKPSFSAAAPRVLFTGSFLPTRRGEAAYDVTADGKKFLMLQRDASGPPPTLFVALDWFPEFEARMRRGEDAQ